MPDRSPGTVEVEGEDHPYVFAGELLASVTTETADTPRWTEIELFRFTDGTGRYLVHIVGRSVLYHVRGSTCNAGVPTPMWELPEDAEPCPRCHPAPLRADNGLPIDAENDRHTVTVCADVAEVLQALRLPGRRGYSAPAQRLLDHVKQLDPVFGAATRAAERL